MPIVGDVLAERYRIEGVLGAGGMASVYRAVDLRLDRAVAVKVLSANLAADHNLAHRFEREARALAAAAHPSVVAVFDVAPGDPDTGLEPFYVMELCDGGTLADRLHANGTLAPAELIPTMAAVGEGLAELHRRGIVHRDIKPANIVYLGDRPKLADFGLARTEEQDLTTLTAKGMTVGTLAYLAPELLAGAPATPASDVYALGVTAFQGLTGRFPKDSGSIGDVIESRLEAAPLVSSVTPAIGAAFDRPIASALSIDPVERPAADDLADQLAEALPPALSGPRSGRSARTRPFFDAADPMPATALAIPAPVDEQAVAQAAAVREPAAPPVEASSPPAGLAIAPRPPTARAGQRRPEAARKLTDRPGLIVLASFVLVVLILAGLSSLLGGRQSGASPTAPLVVVSSPSARPSASPASASPPASRSPVVTPSPNPAARALAALEKVVDAIEAARGGGGLKGKEANELERIAGDVRRALDAGEFDEAREGADRLSERIAKDARELDKTRRERLQAAVAALIDAIPED